MNLLLIRTSGETMDITQLVDGIQWSGDYQQAARKLEVDILYAVTDKNQPMIVPEIGEMLLLQDDNGAEMFRGIVFNRDRATSSQFVKITAYDHLIYLLKSQISYNFKASTPEDIARKICADFDIPIGSFAATGVAINHIALGECPYDIVMGAYTKAANVNGNKYMPIMHNGSLYVIVKGQKIVDIVLDPDTNISNAQYNENLEQMVNKVIIYDDKANIVNSVENNGWMQAYGLLQQAIQYDKDKDNMAIAQKKLKDIERKAQVEALGNPNCITGNRITIYEEHTGLYGVFYINGDTHSWKNGVYTMSLVVSLDNLMDEKELQDEKSNSDSDSKKNGGAGGTDWLDNWEVKDPHVHGQ